MNDSCDELQQTKKKAIVFSTDTTAHTGPKNGGPKTRLQQKHRFKK
jgi:hypothetical protein